MIIRRSARFRDRLARELRPDGRPSIAQFDEILGEGVELTFRVFWDDEPTVQKVGGIRVVTTGLVPPFVFPPASFYAHQPEPTVIELLDVEFDWEFFEER